MKREIRESSRPVLCSRSGKFCYDKKGAVSQANRLRRKGRDDDYRIYPCRHCRGWHLTKKL